MIHSVLIIDDEQIGTQNLHRFLKSKNIDATIKSVYEEDDILNSVKNDYFNIAIVDLRMDKYQFSGVDVIKDIIHLSSFAKVIIISAFTSEFEEELNPLFKTGRIAGVISKDQFEIFADRVYYTLKSVMEDFETNLTSNQTALTAAYNDAKNESNNYLKGTKFENFVSFMMNFIGFNHINKRVIDKSRNEVDLVVRNDIDDIFFNKFSPYFFIECKNTKEGVDKNTFIVFKEKIDKSNNLVNLGFLITSGNFKRTAYLEALRTSGTDKKIVFLSNNEIVDIITSIEPLSALKFIIDKQVKDN